MNKRKFCKIAEKGLLITGATSFAIGFVPYVCGEYNNTSLIAYAGIGVSLAAASLIPHDILYKYHLRDEELESKKNSETYKKSLEKEIDKFESFGMYVINKTKHYPEELRNEIFNDFDIDMEILKHKLELLEEDDEEHIDYLFERINELSSYMKSKEYDNLRNKFYKKTDNKVLEFKSESKDDGSNNVLKLTRKKTSNDKKE
ncbi:MAG: hypothetical protein J5970_03295 [Bacilli bacterium]|nr:hypothetical protein [Bacilli bacterium]